MEVELADRLRLHRALDGCIKTGADQDLPAGCAGAEPRGKVRDRSDHAVVVPPFEADPTERCVPRFDADAEAELRSSLPPCLGERLEPLLRGECEPNRHLLVIVDRERIVEEHEQPVAGEMLERPAVDRNQLSEHAVVLAQHLEDLLRRSGLDERREPPEVAEHARHIRAMSGQKTLAVLAGDEFRDLRRDESRQLGPLPLDRVDQTRVCERNRGLIGEGLNQRNVLCGERLRLPPYEHDDADQILVHLDRHCKQRPVGERSGIDVLGIGKDIGHVDGSARHRRTAGTRRPVERMWMVTLVVHGLRRAAIRRQSENGVIQEIESTVVRAAEAPGRLNHLVEDGLQPGGASDSAEDTADRALLLAELLELTFEPRLVSGHRRHGGSLGTYQVERGDLAPPRASAHDREMLEWVVARIPPTWLALLKRVVAWIPPTWLVMLAGGLGFAAGPLVLSLGAGSELEELLRRSGPFTLWTALIGMQTMLWLLASVPLLLILARHWTSASNAGLRVLRQVVPNAVLLVGLVVSLMFAASRNPVDQFLPYLTWKVRLLTGAALLVALVASMSVWIIRGRLEHLLEQGPTKETLATYSELRADLDRLLAYLGAVVGLAVLSSAAMRTVVQDVATSHLVPGVTLDSLARFHAEAVIVYGLVLTLILAGTYLPTLAVARAVGGKLRDELVPFPDPGQLVDAFEKRAKLNDALGLTVSATASFRAAVAILSPLLGGLASLLPKIGGG